MSRKNLIARVHIAKKDLELNDDVYRQALQGATGKASCAKMSDSELEKVLVHFKQCGWKPAKAKSRRLSPKSRDSLVHDIVDKIRAVWIDMHKNGLVSDGTEAALDVWVKRTTRQLNKGIGVDRTEWLRSPNNRKIAGKVLASLKQWQKRVLRQWEKADIQKISQEQKRSGLCQAEVIVQLLNSNTIFWWSLFAELNIEDDPKFCRDRKELNHG